MILKTQATLYEHEVAEKLAKELAEGEDDGWTYVAEPKNERFSVIKIYDEDGEYVGDWGS